MTRACFIDDVNTTLINTERTKARRPKNRVLIFAIAVLAVQLSLVGCRDSQPPSDLDEQVHDEGLFGDPYYIITNRHAAIPDEPPVLEGDTLDIQVAYTGGCQDHGFELEYESVHDTTSLWIRHRDGGDRCEERVYETLQFPLPEDALDARTILLLNPEYEVPFVLRWGTRTPFDSIGFFQSEH